MRWIRVVLGTLACQILLNINCLAAMPAVSENIGFVKVCGTAKILGDEDNYKKIAYENAKKKAVGKAASRFITNGGDPRFKGIYDHYQRYVDSGKIKVIKKDKANGKYLMFCVVPVDFGLIDKDIKKFGRIEQNREQNENDEAVFLVRVVGVDDQELINKIPSRVLTDYEHAFKEMGFKASSNMSAEAMNIILASVGASKPNVTSYTQYRAAMERELGNMVDVLFAVVGEIRVTKTGAAADSAYAEVECMVESWNVSDQGIKVIHQFKETYNGTRIDKKTAVAFAIQKAAVNSAKHLAGATYNYWQSRK